MRAVVQRVLSASVTVGDRVVGRIGRGLLIFLGVERGDGLDDAERVAGKVREFAKPLYEDVVRRLQADGLTVATGEFQADMHVALVNDGPITLLLDSRKRV